jgi:TRAP transporter TAXI family solute receptor
MDKRSLQIAVAAGALVAAFAFPAAAQQQMTLAGSSEGGTMYRLGAAISEVFNKSQKDVRLNLIVGGGAANPARVGGGGANFGFSFSNFAVSAYNGKAPFDKSFKALRHVGAFWQSCYHQYVAQDLYDSGIKSWDDIVASKKPLSIGAGPAGTSTDAINKLLLAAYGTSFEALTSRGYKFTYTSMGATSDAMRSGQVDIYFHNSGDPNAAGIKAALGRKLTFLDASDKLKSTLADAGFSPCTIPGGIYENVDTGHASMGALGVLMANESVGEAVVYELLKTINGNIKTLGGAHKIFASWTPDYGAAQYGMPMHPGAEKFYKEVGALK